MAVQSFNRRFPLSLGSQSRVVSDTAALTAALATATSGTVIYLAPGSYESAVDEAIEVPAGVCLVGLAGPTVTSIDMPSGTITEPTIVFHGDNYVDEIWFKSRTSSVECGGICLTGANHTFRNCTIDGNQDNFAFGRYQVGTTTERVSTSTQTSCTTSGTTFTKTNAFANYTWRSGDKIVIISGTGVTPGIYTIASKTDASNVVLSSAPGDSSNASAIICSQEAHWYGGLKLIGCRSDDWNFDFTKRASVCSSIGGEDIECENCTFVGTSSAQAFIRDSYNSFIARNCLFDGALCGTGFNIYSRNGIIYKTAQAGSSTHLALSAASWTASTFTVTKTGAFALYTFRRGDTLSIASGTGLTPGTYTIASRVSDDAITLTGSPSPGGSDAADLEGTVLPVYRVFMDGCTIRCYSTAVAQGLFRMGGAVSAARKGVEIALNNCWIDGIATTLLAKGAAHATVTPKSTITLTNCRLPEGWTASSSTMSNINVSNGMTAALRGGTQTAVSVTLTDGATITGDPNLGETQVCTGIAGDRTLAMTANGPAYHTGQRVTFIFASDGTGRTVTPDGSTIKGEAVSVSATSTLRTMVSYRYTGSYWAQDGSPAVSGGVTDIGY